MPVRKTDLVRRSLFGAGVAEHGSEQPESPRAPRPKRARQHTSVDPRPARTGNQQPIEEAPPETNGRRQVERTAVTVPTDLLMRVKDAVAVLNGWPHQYTMARFVEEAFSAQLERMKVDHNGGREFPVTNRKIRTGRPPGS